MSNILKCRKQDIGECFVHNPAKFFYHLTGVKEPGNIHIDRIENV